MLSATTATKTMADAGDGASDRPSEPDDSIRSGGSGWNLDVVMALRTLEAVEKDARSVSGSLSSLLSSLESALSKVTTSTVEHLQCYNEVAGCVQEAALDAATKGNRFINACLRLNEEMKGVTDLAAQMYPLLLIFWSYSIFCNLQVTIFSHFGACRVVDSIFAVSPERVNRKVLRQTVDHLDRQVSRLLPRTG